jgi:hypothetical protein
MRHYLLPIIFIFLSQLLCAQGSSDPGLSMAGSLGDLRTGNMRDTVAPKKHSMRVTQSVALGEGNVLLLPSALDVYLQLNKFMRFQVRGPIFMARHKDIKTATIGDIFLMYAVTVLDRPKHSLIVNGGVKLPTNQSKLTYNDSILPMVYQSSLGTFDFILSVQHRWRHKLGMFSTAFAYQQPFKQINHNKFPATFELRRKADILLRADQVFSVKKELDLGVGLLYFYHAKNDTRLNGLGVREAIYGSKGSTLNVTAMLNWYITKSIELGMNFGVPVVERKLQPEGLHREFVFNPYLQFNL